jgi:sigma-B regulation protein RsbU (phosphoserine phosphatase)
MACFKMLLKERRGKESPAQSLMGINENLGGEDLRKFITVCYGVWDPSTCELTYANGGHHPIPILDLETGELTMCPSSGLFVGIMPGVKIQDRVLSLHGRQRLLLYTDGLNEVFNPMRAQLGHPRVLSILQESRGASNQTLVKNLLEAVESFREGSPLVDDIAILACDF